MGGDCLFCAIADKKIPASIVYEDDAAIGFLDIHPRAMGHTMVIPKHHFETILDAKDGELSGVFIAVKKVTELLKKKLNPDGFTIGINQGTVAGQVIPHLHIHIMPRWASDGGGSVHSAVNNPGNKTVDEVFRILTS